MTAVQHGDTEDTEKGGEQQKMNHDGTEFIRLRREHDMKPPSEPCPERI